MTPDQIADDDRGRHAAARAFLSDPARRCLVEELRDHPAEEVDKTLWALGYRAHIRGPFLCDNCGKPMSDHDEMAHCWPAHSDGSNASEEKPGFSGPHGE